MSERAGSHTAGRAMSAQEPDRSTPTRDVKPQIGLSYMPRYQPSEGTLNAPLQQHHVRTSYNADLEAEWAAAGAPSGPIVCVRIAMTEASREGRALVASGAPEPIISPPTTCRS